MALVIFVMPSLDEFKAHAEKKPEYSALFAHYLQWPDASNDVEMIPPQSESKTDLSPRQRGDHNKKEDWHEAGLPPVNWSLSISPSHCWTYPSHLIHRCESRFYSAVIISFIMPSVIHGAFCLSLYILMPQSTMQQTHIRLSIPNM